jgi:hypothetical protein
MEVVYFTETMADNSIPESGLGVGVRRLCSVSNSEFGYSELRVLVILRRSKFEPDAYQFQHFASAFGYGVVTLLPACHLPAISGQHPLLLRRRFARNLR